MELSLFTRIQLLSKPNVHKGGKGRGVWLGVLWDGGVGGGLRVEGREGGSFCGGGRGGMLKQSSTQPLKA